MVSSLLASSLVLLISSASASARSDAEARSPASELDAPAPPADTLPLTLAEAERLALATSPALRAAEAGIRAGEGHLTQAGAYPNPELVVDATRLTDGGGPKETTLALRQPLPWRAARTADRGEAEARIESARRDCERVRCDLLLEVRSLYLRAYYAAAILQVKQDDLETTRTLRAGAEARVAAGDAPPFEAMKAAVEMARAESETNRARGEQEAGMQSLNLLLGLPASSPRRPVAPGSLEEDDAGAALEALLERALAVEPSIRAAEGAALAAEAAAKRARLQKRPDLALGPIFGDDQGDLYAGLNLAVLLPLWNRNKGGIAAAEATRDAARAEAEQARLAVSRQVAEALGRHRAARARQEAFQQGALAQAADMLEKARLAYQSGETGLLDYLDARRTTIAVREEALRAGLDAGLAAVALARALGADAEPRTP